MLDQAGAAEGALAGDAGLFPMTIENACPGEGCSYGEWVACGPTDLYDEPGAEGPVGALEVGRRFEVTTGVMMIERPTVVLVTDSTKQTPWQPNSLTFAPGDTLMVLGYRGEGFFNALYGDTIVSTFVFWEWIDSGPQDTHTGTVLEEGAAAFWVAMMEAGEQLWINVNTSSVANPSSLSPDPAVCR